MPKAVKALLVAIKIVLTISLVIYLFVLTYDHTSEIKRVKINYSLTKEEYNLLQDGDILLRHGYGFVSDMIVKTLKEDFSISHCAILVKDDSAFNVIHSVSQSLSEFDGVQIQDLRRFVNDSKKNSLIVLRYKNSNGEDRESISQRARYYLERQVPFDNSFDINDTTRYFCTELIWKIFLDAFNIDIFEKKYGLGGTEFLKFDIFFDPDLFEIILSHHPPKSR